MTEEPKKPDALAKLETGLADLKTSGESKPILASMSGGVAPAILYQGASSLVLHEDQLAVLKEFTTAPDEDLDIKPTGEVYASHEFYRRVLTKAFGPNWTLLPVSNPEGRREGDRAYVMQTWALIVNGCFVAQAVGVGNYFASNSNQDMGDALETAASQALMRCAAKSSLGIGINPWNKRLAQEWRRKYAVRVLIKQRDGRKTVWRRADADPLKDEETVLKQDQQVPAAGSPLPASEGEAGSVSAASAQPRTPPAKASDPSDEDLQLFDTGAATPSTVRGDRDSPDPVNGGSKGSAQPPAPTPALVTPTNWRQFMAKCRAKKLIVTDPATKADSAHAAITWLVDKGFCEMPKGTNGKTSVEVLKGMFDTLTLEAFTGKVIPAMMEVK